MGTRVMKENLQRENIYNKTTSSRHTSSAVHDILKDEFDEDEVQKYDQEREEQLKRFTACGFSLVSLLAENVLSHPWIILRRQCQVNHLGERYHLTPFTLFHVAYNLTNSHGALTFWKGIGSTIAIRTSVILTESVLCDIFNAPREVSRRSSVKNIAQHMFLKSLVNALATPFYAANLPETVQSDIASEKPGLFDCFKEGVSRLMGWGVPKTTRLLSVWYLVIPTVTFRLTHYVISAVARYTVTSRLSVERKELQVDETEDASVSRAFEAHFSEFIAVFTGNLIADITLHPLDTVLNRLYVQGTRTIIDNVDGGLGVVPVNTRYEGFMDCVHEMITTEGVSSFYRGFGAVVVQYCFHAALLQLTRFVFERFYSSQISHRK